MKTITRLSRWRASFGVEAFRSMPSFLGLELVASSLLLRLRLPSSPLEVGVVVPLSLTLPATSLMRLWCCTAPPTTRQQTKAKLINVSGFLFWFYWQVCVEYAKTGNLPAARQGTHIPGLKNFSFFFLFHLLLLNDWLPSILLADWISSQSKGCRCSLHIQSNCFCVR